MPDQPSLGLDFTPTPKQVHEVRGYVGTYAAILADPDVDPDRRAAFEDLLADARAWLKEAGHDVS